MHVYRIEIAGRADQGPESCDADALRLLRDAGLAGVQRVRASRLYFLTGPLTDRDAEHIARNLLADPVVETASVTGAGGATDRPDVGVDFEIHPLPGVMDPVAESVLAELRAEGYAVETVRTARRFVVEGEVEPAALLAAVGRTLANDCIERVVLGRAAVEGRTAAPTGGFELRRIALRELDDEALSRLSRTGHLFLSLEEMRAIRDHYRELGREPTDLELETLAQTWSEHCVHKTLRSAVVYRGAPLPAGDGRRTSDGERGAARAERAGAAAAGAGPRDPHEVEIRHENLLADTIMRATQRLIAAGRGPACLSVFRDNAGVVAFDECFGVAFKVETHNHPSAIEPYGGASTGVGGCIRDVIGCGLGARPIANTDVFCVAPSDWPQTELPPGVLHPWRVLRGVVKGVSDYGNRMGIPTVNGAVYFDPRYLGNPLVFCGCVGLIPRDRVEKRVRAGDLIVLVGGRTGRDGIHGATFSSAELSGSHADEFSHAVQIGNAITEKRVLDAVMRARDDDAGCLYSAITDCGAGGLSSAVGEMGAEVGAVVELERVPLKYAGLRYDEIWISEAQERMVLAVPPERLERLLQVMREEEVEATVIGAFGAGDARRATDDAPAPAAPTTARLVVRFRGEVVGDLDTHFLHDGRPRPTRTARWEHGAAGGRPPAPRDAPFTRRLLGELSRPVVRSKEWIIRQYDHEVQGASVVKPLCGTGSGPSDAAVLRPRFDSDRGVAVGCGLAPHLSDVDPYWMALAALDEAIRNVVCVGGDPRRTAVLDNFCWGRTEDPRELGGLLRACHGCHDGALAYGTPFISGKDSLNNELALEASDADRLLEALRRYAEGATRDAARFSAGLAAVQERLRRDGRLSIPGTLLVSALSLVEDVRRCVTADLKRPGAGLVLAGGFRATDFDPAAAARVHAAVANAIARGQVAACHDVSDGGWAVALAEMCIAGRRGAEVAATPGADPDPFEECVAGYVIEAPDAAGLAEALRSAGVPAVVMGRVSGEAELAWGGQRVSIAELTGAWSRGPVG